MDTTIEFSTKIERTQIAKDLLGLKTEFPSSDMVFLMAHEGVRITYAYANYACKKMQIAPQHNAHIRTLIDIECDIYVRMTEQPLFHDEIRGRITTLREWLKTVEYNGPQPAYPDVSETNAKALIKCLACCLVVAYYAYKTKVDMCQRITCNNFVAVCFEDQVDTLNANFGAEGLHAFIPNLF